MKGITYSTPIKKSPYFRVINVWVKSIKISNSKPAQDEKNNTRTE